jgi:hypothetical protein
LVYQQENTAVLLGKQQVISSCSGFRYQAQTERLGALRDVLPNEPMVEAEPQETTPLPPLETNP